MSLCGDSARVVSVRGCDVLRHGHGPLVLFLRRVHDFVLAKWGGGADRLLRVRGEVRGGGAGWGARRRGWTGCEARGGRARCENMQDNVIVRGRDAYRVISGC